MIQITPHMRILVAVEPVDLKKGIDGLARLCRIEPLAGHLFIFRNRNKTAIKILTYDGQGFWICDKRLSSCRFQWWPNKNTEKLSSLHAHELQDPDMERQPMEFKRSPHVEKYCSIKK